MGTQVYLEDVRVSFPHLTKPHGYQQSTPKYQCDLLIKPDSENWQKIWNAVQEQAQTAWGEHAAAMLNMLQQDRKTRCYGSGAEKIDKKTMQPLKGYDNMMYVGVKNTDRPGIFKPDGAQVNVANDIEYQQFAGKIYGGCYVNAAIDIYASTQNNGIFGGLMALQFLRDGEAFGGGAPDVSGMFGAVPGAASGAPSPAGMPTPNATPQPTTTPAPGMPQAPFGAPGMPSFMPPGDD